MPTDKTTRRIDTGVTQWTFEKTCQLVGTSYLWLVGVVAPAAALLTWLVVSIASGSVIDGLSGGLWFFLIFVVVFAIIAVGGALVALPFTHVLGHGLHRVRNPFTHAFAHAAIAGTLAAISMQILLLMFEDDTLTWQYPLALAAPAGVAAAIARWRLDIVKPSTIPGTNQPAFVDEAAE